MNVFHYPSAKAELQLKTIADRGQEFPAKAYEDVTRILEDVKKDGDNAVIEYTNRFDAPELTAASLKVTEAEIESALKAVDKGFLNSLNRAADQIESFHKQQRINSWIDTSRPGVLLGQLIHAVGAAGIYVPGAQGGKTPLVSSVLMGAIPAKIAGVKQICMVTPPTKEGQIDKHLLVAAHTVGVDSIFKTGSAWAIGALAYGTQTIPTVDVIVGPGNIYVTIAKKIVAGMVGIDMIAGPSEILVLADETADPDFIAADLLSQAEHDPLSSALLVTTSQHVADKTLEKITLQLETLDRKVLAEKSLENYGGIMIVPDLDVAVTLANRIAPEHLELQIENPMEYIGRIRNAGAIFLGNYTPEPIGDYIAGPNHVLPTAGTARFASALSVDHFIKRTSLIHYSKTAFMEEAADVIRLAEIEGLGAHANSVKVRLKKDRP